MKPIQEIEGLLLSSKIVKRKDQTVYLVKEIELKEAFDKIKTGEYLLKAGNIYILEGEESTEVFIAGQDEPYDQDKVIVVGGGSSYNGVKEVIGDLVDNTDPEKPKVNLPTSMRLSGDPNGIAARGLWGNYTFMYDYNKDPVPNFTGNTSVYMGEMGFVDEEGDEHAYISVTGANGSESAGSSESVYVFPHHDKGSIDLSVVGDILDTLNGLETKLQGEIDGKSPIEHTHNASDINAGTLDDARIPDLNASKITTGTLSIARIPTGTTSSTVSLGDHTHSNASITVAGFMSAEDKVKLDGLDSDLNSKLASLEARVQALENPTP